MREEAQAKPSKSKEDSSVTTDGDALSKPPSKKIKLGTKKESSLAGNLSQAKKMEQALVSPVSPPTAEATDAGQAAPPHAAPVRKVTSSVPVLRSADSKLPAKASTASPAPAEMAVKGHSTQGQPDEEPARIANDSRRQDWLQRDQQSFIFDEITDPSLLALFDTAVPGSPTAHAAQQLTEREQVRQLQPIAHAIKKALEGVLADVMRKFMHAGSRDGMPTVQSQEARHAFSELVQLFNRAKVAAVDGKEADMLDELTSIRSSLNEFLQLRFKEGTRHFSIEKQERERLRTGLHDLLLQCREWLHEDENESTRPWSPSFAPLDPEARQRAVSSPIRPSEPWTLTEDGRTGRLSSSLSAQLSARPSQHRFGPTSPGAAAAASPTSTPISSPFTSPSASPFTSPVVSPILSPILSSKAAMSPKESTKPFHISALIGSVLSPRPKEAGRKESAVKGHARQPVLTDPGSHADLPSQQSDKPVPQEKVMPQKSSKTLH
ncbi:MAG: hypothetical protein ACJ8G3_13540 [Burkholderiaceae bacterium]